MKYHNDIPQIENCDMVVGIPSFNNSTTIPHVAQTAAEGIRRLGLKGLIVNSDGGSTDGTAEAFLASDTFEVPKFSLRYRGIPGKGSAVRALFEVAHKSKARIFIMLDSDLRSVEPWWIERMARPILEDRTDYVTPLYLRHKYDGTITNNICYPLTSALYGVKVRQPIGGDFAVSSKLIEVFLSKPENVWQSNVARFGIDIWMTTTAINESQKLPVQAALGVKVHDVKDPGKQLQGMFVQVVQTLFELMIEYQDRWKTVSEVIDTEVHGEQPSQEVEEIVVDLKNLKEKASKTLRERMPSRVSLRKELLKSVLENGTLDAEQWVEAVYEFALAYKRERSEEIVLDLLPFYFARVADFVEKTKDISSVEAEGLMESQLQLFMQMKDSFKRRWSVDT